MTPKQNFLKPSNDGDTNMDGKRIGKLLFTTVDKQGLLQKLMAASGKCKKGHFSTIKKLNRAPLI